MKIIDVGVVLNNNDPQGIGRIRYRPYGAFKSEIEHSMEYEQWDENDQFIATPFLPPHINVIPQIRQSVKIIKYDTDKDTQNVEYIAGPYSSPHDFGSETFTTQNKYTTYGGVIVKKKPAVRDATTGEYINKKSPGTLPKLTDNGISGNYGSDVIFTENGVVIRGGKLMSKRTENKTQRQQLQDVPLLSDKISKINLKKFPKKMELQTKVEEERKITVGKINYVIEYELNNLSSPTALIFYVYKVRNGYGQKYNTDSFDESTVLLTEEVKLINTDGSTTTPTAIITGSSLNALCSEARGFLQKIHKQTLNDVNPSYTKEDIHPLYFRPTPNFRILKPNGTTEESNKKTFLDAVKLIKAGPRWGLYFSITSQDPPVKVAQVKTDEVKVVSQTEEQTFAATTSDNIYFLSTSANKGEKKSIDFSKLDKYEYTQDDYLKNIDPNTYAVVRGETLIRLITLLYKYLTEHKHNIVSLPIVEDQLNAELEQMITTMQESLVNQSIRIN